MTPDADRLARRALAESGMLLLGECHGVRENAAVIRALAERWSIDRIVLEWPAVQPVIDLFAASGELADDPWLWSGDGRITAEHLAMLRALAGKDITFALIDRVGALPLTWTARDRAMADAALAAASRSNRALVVAGNAHTQISQTSLGTPMGAWIARVRHGVREIGIEYGSGSFFNFTLKTFPDRFAEEATARLRIEDGSLRLRLPRARSATVAFAG